MDLRALSSSTEKLKKKSVWTQISVVLASIVCLLIVNTCQLSFLKLYQEFLEVQMPQQPPDISHIALISSALFLLSSPLYGVLLHQSNLNKVSIYSSFISFAAFFVGSFSKNVDYFVFSVSLLSGIGLSGLHLASIVALSLTFDTSFPAVFGLVLCASKASQFLHEPFTDLLIATYNWDGTCQVLAALCLNGVVCGLIFNFPNNIEALGLEWLFECPSFEIRQENEFKNSPEVGFKDSYVIRSILQEKEKSRDESNKSLDGCIITNNNTIFRPPSCERLIEREETPSEQTHNDSHCTLQRSHTTLQNSSSFSLSYCSLQSCFHAENIYQVSTSPHATTKKTKDFSQPSKGNGSNFVKTCKNIPILFFCASFLLAYLGILIASSFLMRRALSQGIGMQDIHLIYLLSTCSEMFHCFFVGLILQIRRLDVSVFYSGLLLATCGLVVALNWAVNTSSLITFVILFAFSKAGQSVVRVVLLRRLFGGHIFTQTYCLSLLFEALAATVGPLIADSLKEHSVSFEYVITWSSGILFVAFLISAFVVYARRKDGRKHMKESTKTNSKLVEF